MKSLIRKILKEDSNEKEYFLLLTSLEKFTSKLNYPEVCKIVVDWVLDENDEIWVTAIISQDWYFEIKPEISGVLPENKVGRVAAIKKDIAKKIESILGITVTVGSYVTKCD